MRHLIDGRTWLSDRSMAINIAFRDRTIWSVRQVIGCDVISEGRVNNCLPVPDHWELLHRNGVVVSTALTEWFERVEEYMPSVEHYGVPTGYASVNRSRSPGRAITKAIESN